MTKLAQRQMQVSISGLPGLWATKSGGEVAADVTAVWDGGSDYPEQLASPATVGNLTVSRPIDDIRDIPIMKELRKSVGKRRATITVQTTDINGFPLGKPTVYPKALLVTMNEAEYDAAGSDAQVLELEWALGEVA